MAARSPAIRSFNTSSLQILPPTIARIPPFSYINLYLKLICRARAPHSKARNRDSLISVKVIKVSAMRLRDTAARRDPKMPVFSTISFKDKHKHKGKVSQSMAMTGVCKEARWKVGMGLRGYTLVELVCDTQLGSTGT